MILFLDASIIIWRAEGLPQFQQAAHEAFDELRRLHAAPVLAASRLSWLECRVKPLREGDRALLASYSRFFSGGVQIVELSAEVVDHATELRAKFGLKTPDALQAASALRLPGPSIFLTGDAGFSRVKGLQVQVVKPLTQAQMRATARAR